MQSDEKMGKQGMSAKQLLSILDKNDQLLEANLSTMMQNNFGF